MQPFPLLQVPLLALTAVRKQQSPPSRHHHAIACRSVQPAFLKPFQKSISEALQSLIQGLREAPPFNWNPTNQKVTPDASPERKERQSFVFVLNCLFCNKTLSFTFILVVAGLQATQLHYKIRVCFRILSSFLGVEWVVIRPFRITPLLLLT